MKLHFYGAVRTTTGSMHVVEAAGKVLGTVTQPHGVGAVLLALPDGGWLAGTSHGQVVHIGANGSRQLEAVKLP